MQRPAASQRRVRQSPGSAQSAALTQLTQAPLDEHTPVGHGLPAACGCGSHVPFARLQYARLHAPGSLQSASRAHFTHWPAPTQCEPSALQSTRSARAPSEEHRTAVSASQLWSPGTQRLHIARSASHNPASQRATSCRSASPCAQAQSESPRQTERAAAQGAPRHRPPSASQLPAAHVSSALKPIPPELQCSSASPRQRNSPGLQLAQLMAAKPT